MTLTARPKTAPHSRKRTGQHHRHSKNYLKSYWPYLPIVLIIVGTILSIQAPHRGVLGATTDLTPQVLLGDTNQVRTGSNVDQLSLSAKLDMAAQNKANNMVQENYWSHDSPSGQTPWDFITAAGYSYTRAGENLAYGFSSSQQVINAWLNSPDHRANLLDKYYTQVGFGVSTSSDYLSNGPATIIVSLYAQPTVTNTLSGTNSLVQSAPVSPLTNDQPTSVAVDKIETVAEWSPINISFWLFTAVLVCSGIFIIRHTVFWHRALVKSEAFVIRHPLLDIALSALVALGYMMSRTTGHIL